MAKCGFKEIRKDRAYYDLENLIDISQLNIKIASGYQASMGLYDKKILLCTELANKLLNSKSVYEVMQESFRHLGFEAAKEALTNQIVGQTVMTQ